MKSRPTLTYVTALYPSVSLRFIQREIEALRGRGIDVNVISVRTPEPSDVKSQADADSFAETTYLRPVSALDLMLAHLTALARSPDGYLTTLLQALRGGGWDLQKILWQIFYFVQAIVLWRLCDRRDDRRLHVHFANVAADLTMLAVAFGRRERRDDDAWSWTLTMHGPTEFADVTRFNLATKATTADGVACISHYCRSQLMTITNPDAWDRFAVIRLGLERGFEDDSRAVELHVDHTTTGTVQLLTVGRLVPEKGHATLLQALGRLPNDAEWSLQLVGSGPEDGALRQIATDLGIASKVVFLGALGNDEVRRLYRSADIFCLASFAEGLPVVLMEAMASGLPVVTTRIAAIPELVVDCSSGAMASAGDVDGLSDRLSRLITNARERDRLGACARERVRALHDLDRNADQLKTFLLKRHRLA